MKKYSGKLLLGAVSGLSLIMAPQVVKAEPTDTEIICDYPLYNEYQLQESDCSGPVELREEPAGPYTS